MKLKNLIVPDLLELLYKGQHQMMGDWSRLSEFSSMVLNTLFWELQGTFGVKLPYSYPFPTVLTTNTVSWLQESTRTTPRVPDGSRPVFQLILKAALSRQHSQNQSGSNRRLWFCHPPAHQLWGQESQRGDCKKRSRRKPVYEHLFPHEHGKREST